MNIGIDSTGLQKSAGGMEHNFSTRYSHIWCFDEGGVDCRLTSRSRISHCSLTALTVVAVASEPLCSIHQTIQWALNAISSLLQQPCLHNIVIVDRLFQHNQITALTSSVRWGGAALVFFLSVSTSAQTSQSSKLSTIISKPWFLSFHKLEMQMSPHPYSTGKISQLSSLCDWSACQIYLFLLQCWYLIWINWACSALIYYMPQSMTV